MVSIDHRDRGAIEACQHRCPDGYRNCNQFDDLDCVDGYVVELSGELLVSVGALHHTRNGRRKRPSRGLRRNFWRDIVNI